MATIFIQNAMEQMAEDKFLHPGARNTVPRVLYEEVLRLRELTRAAALTISNVRSCDMRLHTDDADRAREALAELEAIHNRLSREIDF